MSRYILGVTGASGAIYAKRTAMHLKRLGHHVTALVTPPGKGVIRYEEQSALFDYVDAQPDVTDFLQSVLAVVPIMRAWSWCRVRWGRLAALLLGLRTIC